MSQSNSIQPSQSDRDEAMTLIEKNVDGEWRVINPGSFANSITSALTRAGKVPDGHVRTPDGVDRKVLGTLPMTLDGVVAGDGASVWINYYGGPPAEFHLHLRSDPTPWEGPQTAHHSYSTREAALAAKGGE